MEGPSTLQRAVEMDSAASVSIRDSLAVLGATVACTDGTSYSPASAPLAFTLNATFGTKCTFQLEWTFDGPFSVSTSDAVFSNSPASPAQAPASSAEIGAADARLPAPPASTSIEVEESLPSESECHQCLRLRGLRPRC